MCAVGLAWLAADALRADERFRSPAPGAVLSAGAVLTAAWSVPCDRADADETELVLSLDGGITFPIRATRSLDACASSYAWRVPDIATANARLGLRQGRRGRGETERILFVSGRFSIVQPGRPHGADLTRGAIEWWTDQALFDVAAEDRLGDLLGRPPVCRADAGSESDADEPGPESTFSRHPDRERLRFAAPALGAAAPRSVASRRPAPVPLRV
jgi:hypothetical protein